MLERDELAAAARRDGGEAGAERAAGDRG